MKIMASEVSAQNTDKTISESLYLGNNYVPVLDFIRNPCQQYHNQIDFNTDQYNNDKSQNCHEEYCDDYKDRNTGPILYSVNATCTLSCSNNDDYDNLNATEWGASSSDTAKESTLSDPLSSDKQSSPESNISPISSSSGSSGIQTSSGTSSELSSGSTGNTSLQDIIPTCIYMLSRVAIYLEIDNTANATVADMVTAILNSEDISLNKPIAENLFTLWMCSSFLELQLKPSHKPVQIRKAWRYLLGQYSQCSTIQQERDEPKVIFKKNIFCPKQYEERIKDPKILELLYSEAKYNILEGRYPCETHHCITLGGIQARIELGPYNPQIHTINFFREQQWKFLPAHIRKSSNWTWLPISSKNSAEVRLLEQYKRIPQSASNKKLIRKYLEFCWSLPFYGAAFFQGQIEQPVRSLTSFMIHQDIPILVAINSECVYVIDNMQGTVLLGLRYEELSWEYARPSREDNKDCLPCLFLQFMVLENGTQVSKILQIFSRQAQMMDTLISSHVDRIKKKIRHHSSDQIDASINTINSDNNTLRSTTMSIYNNPGRHDTKPPCLSNKLNKLVLCTFDEDGRCIGKMGSWSFSY